MFEWSYPIHLITTAQEHNDCAQQQDSH